MPIQLRSELSIKDLNLKGNEIVDITIDVE